MLHPICQIKGIVLVAQSIRKALYGLNDKARRSLL